jgi:hypothetical protein
VENVPREGVEGVGSIGPTLEWEMSRNMWVLGHPLF